MHRPGKPLYYLATMIPVDQEDLCRIEKHQQERSGWGFETIEVGKSVLDSTRSCDQAGTFLLDSVTALLANAMFDANGSADPEAPEKIAGDLTALVEKIENIVLVSDDIYSDACVYDTLTESYRKGLALIDRTLAGLCDMVLEISGGNTITHKPKNHV